MSLLDSNNTVRFLTQLFGIGVLCGMIVSGSLVGSILVSCLLIFLFGALNISLFGLLVFVNMYGATEWNWYHIVVLSAIIVLYAVLFSLRRLFSFFE